MNETMLIKGKMVESYYYNPTVLWIGNSFFYYRFARLSLGKFEIVWSAVLEQEFQ